MLPRSGGAKDTGAATAAAATVVVAATATATPARAAAKATGAFQYFTTARKDSCKHFQSRLTVLTQTAAKTW